MPLFHVHGIMAGMLQILLMRAEADYPKDAPPRLRFIRSCSASLAAS
eukprot:gene26865-34210_t